MIEGIWALHTCKETVPDLQMAKVDLDKTWDFKSSSEITFKFLIFLSLIELTINSLFSSVEWKTNEYSKFFWFISWIKSKRIGSKTVVSDFRLPGNIEIIFLLSVKKLSKFVLIFFWFSIKGWPTNVLLTFSLSKYFFSKSNNKRIWSMKFLIFLTLLSLQTQTWGAT